MLRTAKDTFTVAFCSVAVLLAATIAVIVALHVCPPIADREKLLALQMDLFKTVLVGVIVGGAAILVPATLAEARHRFEQRKESRAAYSEAKTSIDYLKLKLATMSLADAAAALQKAHYYKHMAELFDELPEWLRKRYDESKGMTPLRWDEIMYGRLWNTRRVLEENAARWRYLSPEERIALLDPVLPTESELETGKPSA